SKVCTKWDVNSISMCYGAGDCCALIGLESLGNWDDSFYLSYGRYGSGLENTVKAQVIYANYSIDINNPYSDIAYSSVEELSAEFYYSTITFEDICVDTCLLGGFNESSYKLIINVSNGTLNLEKISYSILESVSNITVNVSEPETEELEQLRAEINKPVKWVKRSVSQNISIPDYAYNISIKKIINNKKSSISNDKIKIKYKGKVKDLIEFEADQKLDKKKEIVENTSLMINETADSFEVKYETEAPIKEEIVVSQVVKKITISSDISYTNVLAYTSITESPRDAVKLYWYKNGSRVDVTNDVEINLKLIDSNSNGLIDRLEWNVPHLSDQVFEIIIEITKASHLDSNRTFISDIYDETYKHDNIWSEPIYHDEYIRVTFRKALDNTRDITILPRNLQGKNTTIGVYYPNSTEKITEFPVITEQKYYKIYLTEMNGSSDFFDLKIENSDNDETAYLEFDHIIDAPEFYDEFDGDQADLSTHAPDIGIGWNQVNASLVGNEYLEVDGSGSMVKGSYGANSDAVLYETNDTISGANYRVEVHINDPDNVDDVGIICARLNYTGIMGYCLEFNADIFQLWERTGHWTAISADLGSVVPDEAGHTVYIEALGDTISAGVDGVEQLSVTDDTSTTPEHAGLGMGSIMNVGGDMGTHDYENFTVTLVYDVTGPTITILTPANNSNWGTSILDFNASINENASWCGLSINGNANVTMTLNSSNRGANYTNSSIADGSYTFIISCNDTAGNWGDSGTYNFVVDTVYPEINFTSPTPANGTTQTQAWFEVNVSINESDLGEVKYNWNGTNFTMYNDSLVLMMNFDNVSALGENNTYVVDLSGYGNNGAVTEAAVNTTDCKFGNCFTFDGNGDYIDAGSDDSLTTLNG
ncbi:MAG: hypothetical protein U9O94_06425, partial [Nanoarchaeota archaeon]|nr:hypothetical protein [Nanoarchaeota archaeon]